MASLFLACIDGRHVVPNSARAFHRAGLWEEAHQARGRLLAYLTEVSGVGTLLDTRRARDYDADACVDRYLNLPAVKARPGLRQDQSTDKLLSRLLQPCKYCSWKFAVTRVPL